MAASSLQATDVISYNTEKLIELLKANCDKISDEVCEAFKGTCTDFGDTKTIVARFYVAM